MNEISKVYQSIQGRREGSSYPVATIVIWSIAGLLLIVGLIGILDMILGIAQGLGGDYNIPRLIGAIIGVVLRTTVLFVIGLALRNPNAFLDIREAGMWQYDKHTRKNQDEPVWISWDQIKDVKKGFLGGMVIKYHNKTKTKVGHFPQTYRSLRKFVKLYNKSR